MVKRVPGRSPRESSLWLAARAVFSQYREIAGETTTRVSVFRLDSSGLIYIATSYSAPRRAAPFPRVHTRWFIARPKFRGSADTLFIGLATLRVALRDCGRISRRYVTAKWNSALSSPLSFKPSFLFRAPLCVLPAAVP